MHSGVDPTYMYNKHVKQPKSSDLFNIEHVCRYSFKQETHRPPRSTENRFFSYYHYKLEQIYENAAMQICKKKKNQNIIITLKNTRMDPRILPSQGCFVPILAEIGQVILEKKIFMSLHCILFSPFFLPLPPFGNTCRSHPSF